MSQKYMDIIDPNQKASLFHSQTEAASFHKIVSTTIEKIQITDSQEKAGSTYYLIHIDLVRDKKQRKPSQTSRRYSQFQKLHLYLKYLYCKNNIIILPRLPSKHGIQDKIMQFDEESKKQFQNQRRQDLEIYLKLLICHNQIKEDRMFKQFLSDSPISQLTKYIQKAQIIVPNSAPQKIVHVVKQTFNTFKKVVENWNAPTVQVDKSLKEKIIKVEQIKFTMNQMLVVENQRILSLRTKKRELDNLKNNQNRSNILQVVAQTLKQKILPSTALVQHQMQNCLPCVQRLYNYIQGRCKQQDHCSDKIQQMKKTLKMMIAKCDSILGLFQQLIGQKSDLQMTKKRLLQFNELIKLPSFINQAAQTLESYQRYYKIINGMDKKQLEKGQLQTVFQNQQYELNSSFEG